MLALDILDGFCWDHGYHLGFGCPRCTNVKVRMRVLNPRFKIFNPNWPCHIYPQESAEDGHGRIYGLVEIYQSSLAPATSR